MILVNLTLRVGHLAHGSFHESDSYDLEIWESDSDVACENVNGFLNTAIDPIHDFAELRLHVSPTGPKDGYLIGSFKKIKLKTKNSSNKYRWIVVD